MKVSLFWLWPQITFSFIRNEGEKENEEEEEAAAVKGKQLCDLFAHFTSDRSDAASVILSRTMYVCSIIWPLIVNNHHMLKFLVA